MSNYNNKLQINNSELQSILDEINSLPKQSSGTDTSDATATAGDILSGKTAYVDGEKITGNIATVTQATPSITVSTNGLITASTTQSAGYVASGSKSSTKQLTTQAATTITPGTTNKTAVYSGRYTTGTVTVKGDSNLVASNIKSGVSIFGVTGNYTGSGGASGGDDSTFIDLIEGDSVALSNDSITKMRNYAFVSCSNLTSVNLPNCSSIGTYAFGYCSNLTSVTMPNCETVESAAFSRCSKLTTIDLTNCTKISSNAFYSCSKITSINLPNCTTVGSSAFYYCSSLTSINLPVCSSVYSNAFRNCYSLSTVELSICKTIGASAFAFCSKLTSLTLGYSSVATLSNANAFYSTPMSVSTYTGSFGSIYVPASLVASYKTANNWSVYASRIVAISGGGDSGDSGENESGDLITFYVTAANGSVTEYQAEEGMIWEDWRYSSYNSERPLIADPSEYYIISRTTREFLYSDITGDTQVTVYEEIIANKYYYLLP